MGGQSLQVADTAAGALSGAEEWSGMGPCGTSEPWGRYPAQRALDRDHAEA